MKALIVDDERLARREMQRLLLAHPDVEVIGEAKNAAMAASMVLALKPDVVFLDIQMPGRDGLELMESWPVQGPKVIFTTAFDEHAVRAFELNALDYLLKPVEAPRLARALERLRQVPSSRLSPGDSPAPESKLGPQDRVFIRNDEKCWFVVVETIGLLESVGNYTKVFFGGEHSLIHGSLTALEKRLPPGLFFRANRSQLINLKFVQTVEPWFSDSLKVTLTTGVAVELSRRQSLLFQEQLKL